MEAYSSSSSSSASSMYSSQYQDARKNLKLSHSFNSSLHSVRKSQAKPSKKPIAPLPPTPPRVYNVDPMNFRDLVQKLTGAAGEESSSLDQYSLPQPHRLQRVAPPPLHILDRQPAAAAAAAGNLINNSPVKTPFSALYQEIMSDTPDHQKSRNVSENAMGAGFVELNLLSPSAWCSFPLLSPGSLSGFDVQNSTVL